MDNQSISSTISEEKIILYKDSQNTITLKDLKRDYENNVRKMFSLFFAGEDSQTNDILLTLQEKEVNQALKQIFFKNRKISGLLKDL